jgi:diaminopimelate decarboxylase
VPASARELLPSVLPDTADVLDGRLVLGGIAASELARRFGTPLHVYDAATLRGRARAYLDALAGYRGGGLIAFACKAQSAVALLRLLGAEGLGADVSSAGELAAARAAGIPAERLVVHGNNKSDADVEAALAAGAGLLVADHAGELDQVERLAAAAGVVQRVGVRVTPGIAVDTHEKIATGHAGSKFGFAPADALDALDRISELPHLRAAGLHVHLGSQITDIASYERACDWLVEFVEENGLGDLELLDLGGGLAIAHADGEIAPPVGPAVERILARLADGLVLRGLPLPRVILEPGRSVAGPAGVTLYTVGGLKRGAAGASHVAVDGGMSDNPRPVLYGARYEALLVDRVDERPDGPYAVVGKHCESGDILVGEALLPAPRTGDVLAVPATGAYTASMASNYNGLPRPAGVLVEGGEARLVVRRETVEDLLAREQPDG